MGNWRYSYNPLFTQLGLVTVVAVLIGGFAVTPGYGQTNSTTTRESFSFESGETPLCGGEDVQLSGTVQFVSDVTIGRDGEFQYSVPHVTFEEVTGVTTSGDRVVLTEADTSVRNIRQISANEFLFQIHATLVTQGNEGDNTVVEIPFRTIINPNGEVITSLEDVKCVG